MNLGSYGGLLADLAAVGTSYASFTTQQSLLTTATATGASTGFITLPPGFFRVGAELDFDIGLAVGWASGQTWIFTVRVGSVNAVVSGTIKTTTSGGTTEPWNIRLGVRCVSVGNGTLATLEGEGIVVGRGVCPPGATAAANYAAGMGQSMWSEATPAAGTGFDSTVAQTLDFQVTSGTSSASNTIQLRRYRVASWGNVAP
ncbi:MAG TPA: hypothetical protein VMU47_06630 [Caldimonas sp.]|nr:hypothetical protein [Caldimonas sp.]